MPQQIQPMAQPDHLDQLLLEQQRLLEQVGQILQSELDALLGGSIDQLPDLAARKTNLCAEIDRLEQARIGLLGTSAAAFAQARQAGPGDGTERARKIRALTQAVAQANQRNGLVVSALLRNTQGALDILRGMPHPGSATVYGPYGQALAGHQSSKPLASA